MLTPDIAAILEPLTRNSERARNYLKYGKDDIAKLCLLLNNPYWTRDLIHSETVSHGTMQVVAHFKEFKVNIVYCELPKIRRKRISSSQGYVTNCNISIFIFRCNSILRYDVQSEAHHQRNLDSHEMYLTLKDRLS